MISAEEMKKVTKEKNNDVINNIMPIIEAIICHSKKHTVTINLSHLEFPDSLIPDLKSKLIELGYAIEIYYDHVIDISWA